MNKILPERPCLVGDEYAPVVPRWLTLCLQLIFIGFAIAIVLSTDFFSNRAWVNMPWFFKGLMLILLPVFIFGGLHPRGWRSLSTDPFFIASSDGISFPFLHHGSLVKGVDPKSWLFVPWQNISNTRTEKHNIDAEGGRSLCAVFDIKAADDELKNFFLLGPWVDKNTHHSAVVFYGNMLPTPKTVVHKLQVLSQRYQTSATLRAKYDS